MVACKKEPVTTHDILGKWEVIEATRSKKPTTTVNGAVFEFEENGGMTTDLLGSLASSPYFIEGNIIIQEIPEVKYKITEQTDSTLFLKAKIQKLDFSFVLKKVNAQ